MNRWIYGAVAGLCLSATLFAAGQEPQRRLLPGDRIQITCEEDPDLSVVRIIGQDGTVLIPELGPVGVATRTPQAVAERIRRLLMDAGILLKATVHVEPQYTKGGPISVSGAVAHPLVLRFTSGTMLSSLLRTAQPSDSADASQVRIFRPDGSVQTIDSTTRDMRLADGDRVVVPLTDGTSSVSVSGGVQSPSAVPYRRGMTLGSALEAAGGLAPRADASKIVVTRQGEPFPVSMPEDKDFEIRAGETIKVTVRSDRRSVIVQGAVSHPGLVDFVPGMTLTQAIAQAGGPAKNLRGDSVWLKTVLGQHPKTVKLSLRFIASNRIPDPVLQADDVVEVGVREPGDRH